MGAAEFNPYGDKKAKLGGQKKPQEQSLSRSRRGKDFPPTIAPNESWEHSGKGEIYLKPGRGAPRKVPLGEGQ